jgi:ABC-type dipeptide/oligopeptide/nickel transport system ATPase component
MAEALLEVENLSTHFHTRDGVVKAVDGVSFHVEPGEVLGIVGESGCGKSVTSLSVMGLVPPPGVIETGKVLFDGADLLQLSQKQLEEIRGDRISMIFQQPQSSLNPVYRVGDQISEVYDIHKKLKKRLGKTKAVEMLERVGIPDPDSRSRSYPHEMSGGMAQRWLLLWNLNS